MITLIEYERKFSSMKWFKKVVWYLFLKKDIDNPPFACTSCFRILEPSYYILHPPEECEREEMRRSELLMKIWEEMKAKRNVR